MRETKKPSLEARVACRYHGEVIETGLPVPSASSVPWKGDVLCAVCRRVYLCEETDGKLVYPHVPDDGFCICGSALFPDAGTVPTGVFSAQAMCSLCARELWPLQNPQAKKHVELEAMGSSDQS